VIDKFRLKLSGSGIKCKNKTTKKSKDFRNMPFIIIGHERSGTSLLAGLIKCCGVDIGKNLLGASIYNRKGHFEEKSVLHFHERLLRKSRSSLINVPTKVKIDEIWRDEVAMEIVRGAYEGNRPWGWKDPRTILFIRKWLGIFPNAIVVLVIRHPYCVFRSLNTRNKRNVQQSMDPWYEVHRRIIDIVPSFKVFLIDDIVKNPGIVVDFMKTKIKITSDAKEKCKRFVDKNLYHHKSIESIPPKISQIWNYLKQMAHME